jgi:hypothetical protein
MKLPGFTAEVSLAKTGERFKTEGPSAGGAATQAVVPQLCRNIGPCVFHRRLRCCVSLFGGVSCKLVSC